jgi:hypothetical protein
MYAPVNVARSIDDHVGLHRARVKERVAEDASRPSASVLSTSIVVPSIAATRSPGARGASSAGGSRSDGDETESVDVGLHSGERREQSDHGRHRPHLYVTHLVHLARGLDGETAGVER